MKNIFYFLFVCGIFFAGVSRVNAQVKDYAFSQSTGTYSAITGTVLSPGDGVFKDLDIGFKFTFNAIDYTKFCVNSYGGFIVLGSSAIDYGSAGISGPDNNAVSAFSLAYDLTTTLAAAADLQYKTVGSSPNDTLVVQWTRYRKSVDISKLGDSYDFQIRLCHTSNVIEVVYGTMTNGAGSDKAEVGLRGGNSDDFNNRTTTTNWAATDPGTLDTATCAVSAAVLPKPSGLTFRWTPTQTQYTYAWCTTIQADTTTVSLDSKNNPIIAIKVAARGNRGTPINITAIKINDASTHFASDVTNVKVYFTGCNSVFDTTTLFGSAMDLSAPIKGAAQLFGGSNPNYFWVTYNISANARKGNVVDAQCESVTTSSEGIKTPVVADPAGERTIYPWTQIADFSGGGGWGKHGTVGFSIGKKGYVGLGNTGGDFWEYDPDSNTWTQKADCPTSASKSAVGFSIGNKGYVGMGDGHTDFWEYDPNSNTWTAKADFPDSVRWWPVDFSIGNKGYVGTGSTTNDPNSASAFKDFWEYDPSKDNDTSSESPWTRKRDFPDNKRYAALGFSIGSKGYVGMGGIRGTNYKDFWEYDPSKDYDSSVENPWTQKSSPGFSVSGTGFPIGRKGYIGGVYNSGTYKQFWEYDPVKDRWIRKTDIPDPRYFPVGFSIGSKGYLGCGYSSGGVSLTDFWEFSPELEVPLPAFSTNQTIICSGSAVTFTDQSAGGITTRKWLFPGGTPDNSTEQNPVVVYNTKGIFNVRLTVGNTVGDSSLTKQSYVIVQSSPQINAGGDMTICFPDTGTTLLTSGAHVKTYKWNPSEGLSCTDCPQPFAHPKQTTEYIVTATSENGCVARDTVVVYVGPKVIADAGNNVDICQGGKTTLYASGGTNFLWSPSDSLSNIHLANPVASPTTTITYTVIVSGSSCASDTDSVTVTVHPNPEVPTITQNGNTLQTDSGKSYMWYRNDTLILGATSQSYTVTQDGKYSVEVKDSNGCTARSASKQVIVGVESETIYRVAPDFVLFPNPNNGKFTFAFDADQKATYDIELRDVLGRLIHQEHLEKFIGHYSNRFDIAFHPKGFYSLLVRSGTERKVVKVLKY